MSRESIEWLNSNVLVGFTEKRGHAWHYKAGSDNHYEGPVPVEEVRRRLFSWEPVAGPVETTVLVDGVATRFSDWERQAIVRPDTGAILGVFKDGYKIHGYNQWLLDNVESILSDDAQIGSAGLLKGGAVAWVQVETEETHYAEGMGYRPHLTATTSLDGTLKTTYFTGTGVVCCDNTLDGAIANLARKYGVKHTRNSEAKIKDARAALGLLEDTTIAFSDAIKELSARGVTERDFTRFLEAYVPVPDEPGRSRTIAVNKRDTLTDLWTSDPRVAPWKGSELGVLQAVNTYEHHYRKGVSELHKRAERNSMRFLLGETGKIDANALTVLREVVAA